ncbi:hypothetical protein BT63DRAFT_450694 [Microthyrium microscopicum]|uniref:Uncharacterized protein n=1 Tax=Microthyrium microscopicum TaxID=703497 RepID=A0A6A6ULL1_9PEZI|nr:hypothetical protein BT63DRAFT_450694 [Microthyrium microscopicum]
MALPLSIWSRYPNPPFPKRYWEPNEMEELAEGLVDEAQEMWLAGNYKGCIPKAYEALDIPGALHYDDRLEMKIMLARALDDPVQVHDAHSDALNYWTLGYCERIHEPEDSPRNKWLQERRAVLHEVEDVLENLKRDLQRNHDEAGRLERQKSRLSLHHSGLGKQLCDLAWELGFKKSVFVLEPLQDPRLELDKQIRRRMREENRLGRTKDKVTTRERASTPAPGRRNHS